MKHRFYLYVKALSDLGSAMDTIVLGALIYSVTHSAGWLAASMCMGVLGGLFTSLSSGVLADQLNRRKIMIISDWLRAGFILLLIPFPNPIMILIVRFISGGLTSFFAVSFSAEVPQIYGEKNVVSINALIARLGAVCMVLGFLGGGVISDWIGNQAVILFDSLSFMLSAFVLMKLKWDTDSQTGERVKRTWQQWKKDLQEVKQYLWLQTPLLLVFIVYLIDTFGSSSHNLGIPLLAEQINPSAKPFIMD